MSILLIISTMITLWIAKQWIQSKQNYNRVNRSFANSKKDVVYYKTQSGKLAAKVDVLEFRNQEIEHIYPEILDELKNLKIKKHAAKQYSETILSNQIHLSAALEDSISNDTLKLQQFEYQDAFYQVSGQIQRDSIQLQINSCDSIIQVVYKGKRKRPWLWFFSKRQLEQVIYSKNPKSEIQYSRVIEIVK
jgi:DNA repair ATPase RecN